jgi:hypothetical protein
MYLSENPSRAVSPKSVPSIVVGRMSRPDRKPYRYQGRDDIHPDESQLFE